MSTDIHALSGAYALDAVSELERADFERHLDGCVHCRDEVRGFRATAICLADTSIDQPPAGLRSRILADARGVRPLPPIESTARRRRRIPALAAAAAMVVAAGAGLTATVWRPWQPDTVQLSLADRVRTAADARTWSTRLPEGGTMSVTRSQSVGAAVWTSTGVGPAPEGHVYELWLQKPDESLVPAGLMSSGDGELVLRGDTRGAIGAGLTVEPAGGSSAPTTEPVAFFDLRVSS
jgi:anti-sigma factor RsiW